MITIIPQGTEPKFQVEIKNFDMKWGDFTVTLTYGYRQTKIVIPKADMVHDDDFNYFFGFDTKDMVGKVTAQCHWKVQDDDYTDNTQEQYDEQFLCFVAPDPCPRIICCPECKTDGQVVYTQTGEHNISVEYQVLCDKEHRPLLTSDNERIMVLKKKR